MLPESYLRIHRALTIMAASTSSSLCNLSRATLRPSKLCLFAPSKAAQHTTKRTVSSTRSSVLSQKTSQSASLSHPSKTAFARCASTSTSTNSTTPANTSASPTGQSTLTWNEYLKLRRTRRYVNLGASIFSGAGSIVAATPLIAEFEIETIGAQLTGLDPMFVIGGSLMGIGGVGWLMGPFLGTAIFKIWKSSVATEFTRVRHLFQSVEKVKARGEEEIPTQKHVGMVDIAWIVVPMTARLCSWTDTNHRKKRTFTLTSNATAQTRRLHPSTTLSRITTARRLAA